MTRRSDLHWEDVTVQTEKGAYPTRGTRIAGWLVTREMWRDGVSFSVTHPASGRALSVGLTLAGAERLAYSLAAIGLTGETPEHELKARRTEVLSVLDNANP